MLSYGGKKDIKLNASLTINTPINIYYNIELMLFASNCNQYITVACKHLCPIMTMRACALAQARIVCGNTLLLFLFSDNLEQVFNAGFKLAVLAIEVVFG